MPALNGLAAATRFPRPNLGHYILTACIGLLAYSTLAAAPALAQSPLGIGTAEPAPGMSGPFAPLLQWINIQQQAFYRALTSALKAMRDDGAGIWMLVGLSFLYGIFHAAGPGHGKAVISSYMLANEVQLRRGVILSFISSLLQALVAVALVGSVFLFLRGTRVSMTDATRFLEIASYALITVFGLWLVWTKIKSLLARPVPASHVHIDDAGHNDGHMHSAACGCGHNHAPAPQSLGETKLTWRTGLSAVLAVGLRPCSGALIVLSFAFLNGLWIGGIISALAMALGTAITVSTLATLAVTAKNTAVRLSGNSRAGTFIHHGVELAGAGFVLLLGLIMLGAALTF